MTLQLYILRQLIVSIGFAMGGISLLVLPTVAIQAIHKLEGVRMVAVFEYLPLVLVELVPYLLPMAFLLGVVATYGRMAADREVTAIRMAGIHPLNMMWPGLVVALVFSAGTNWLLSTVSPEWKYAARNYLRGAEEDVFRSLGRGRTELEFGDFFMVGEPTGRPGEFEDAILNLVQPNGKEQTVVADRVQIQVDERSLLVQFTNAQILGQNETLENEGPVYRMDLSKLVPFIPKNKFRPKYLQSSELRAEIEGGHLDPEKREEFLFEIHRRHALSVTYVLFLLLGVPTGMVLRSGTQLGAYTGAVGYAFLYYILAIRLGKELALLGAVPAIAGAWATNALFLAVGLVFAFRVLWR